ncbi:MAG: hypothetical protein HYT76_10440 [Deltaproteobacteria bacterium]|nr:hypothetical protein [Deltaproteobacteria bacterium]
MKKDFLTIPKIPFSDDEWKASRRYLRLPLQKKLALLDRMRSLMFDLWKENPSIRRDYEKCQKLFK